MNNADKQQVVIVIGNNNTVNIGEKKSHFPAALKFLAGMLAGAGILAVSFDHPEFADFVCSMIGKIIRG